ncbi:MAG TPA: SDR family NAD(P)-dependent oxidoreductase, partial [Chloroflexota bacterium]|nr:SDR family NAD(P)-dependent oxidoreductase [Chloroflexota bacterium]
MRLQGKTAIITGAGSGIGRESALLFASEGATIVAADLNEHSGRET